MGLPSTQEFNSSNGHFKLTLKIEDISNTVVVKPSKTSTPKLLDANYDLDSILGFPSIPPRKQIINPLNPPGNANFNVPLASPSNLDYKMQDTSRDPSFSTTINMQDMYNSGPNFDLSKSHPVGPPQQIWPMDILAPLNPMSFVAPQILDNTSQQDMHLNSYYLDGHNTTQSAAPLFPNSTRDSEHQSSDESTEKSKQPKKRGRKRKSLDQHAQEVERKKFLERNRVAANRCRERKKEWVQNLENRKLQLEYQNSRLRMEMDELFREASDLKQLASMDCGCGTERMENNIRESMKDQRDWVVDGLVDRLKKFRTGSVDEIVLGAMEWNKKERREGNDSSIGSDNNSVFLGEVKKEEETTESSTESSPTEVDKVEK